MSTSTAPTRPAPTPAVTAATEESVMNPQQAVAAYVRAGGIRPLRYEERADAEQQVAAGVPVDVAVHRARYRSQTLTR